MYFLSIRRLFMYIWETLRRASGRRISPTEIPEISAIMLSAALPVTNAFPAMPPVIFRALYLRFYREPSRAAGMEHRSGALGPRRRRWK